MAMTRQKARLLAELESLVRQNCYNDHIQNWGPGGVYEGEGRKFPYPLTIISGTGEPLKIRHQAATGFAPEILATGHYAFGANQLHIITALDDVVRHLEDNYDLKL